MISNELIEQIIDHIWRNTKENPELSIYVILDAARDERIYERLLETDNANACLFSGGRAKELAAVAPYLVRLDPVNSIARWIIEMGWEKSWGIFVESAAEFQDLKRHLQSLVSVYDDEGKPLFFRYYDPRVLRAYLPTCDGSELRTMFGPVSSYYVEDEDSGYMTIFAHASGDLVEQIIHIA